MASLSYLASLLASPSPHLTLLVSVPFTPKIYINSIRARLCEVHTADFIKKVLSVYIHSMTTIYLSMSAQVAKSTFFMKSPVLYWTG